MEAEELMIGDLVMWRGSIRHVKAVRNGEVMVRMIEKCFGDKYLLIENIEPIPLTEEILKANGFEKNDNVQGWQYPNDRVIFCLEELSNVFIWNGVYNDICIEHVHILQHVLRLCGLNELADNFKIK